MLGLEPEADRQRLNLRVPTLPAWMDALDLRHLRLGGEELQLRFERSVHGTSVILTSASEVEVRVASR